MTIELIAGGKSGQL